MHACTKKTNFDDVLFYCYYQNIDGIILHGVWPLQLRC